MKKAWLILIISAFTDFVINVGTALGRCDGGDGNGVDAEPSRDPAVRYRRIGGDGAHDPTGTEGDPRDGGGAGWGCVGGQDFDGGENAVMLPSTTTAADLELADFLVENRERPEVLVATLWEWGTGELAGFDGPDVWQMDFLQKLGAAMRSREFDGVLAARLIKGAVGSGRGIGKSAIIGMTVVMLLSAWPDCKITVTANTETQLDKRTWAEIRIWMNRSVVAHWFEVNSAIIYRKGFKEQCFAAPVTWAEDRPSAFAGQHNIAGPNVYIFDEAPGVPDSIQEVAVSGQTTGLPIFLSFGNVTKTTGFFHRALFGADKERFDISMSIDSRTSRFTSKEKIADDIAEYGIDSDYVRVWILGQAPKASAAQFFDDGLISGCQKALPRALDDDALVAGCDFSWGGEDKNTVWFRCGLDAWSIPPISIPGEFTRDPEIMIGRLSEVLTKKYNGKLVTMLFMDGAGIAGPVGMRLRALGFSNLVEVNFGAHSPDPRYKNVRAMMMARTKELMLKGLGIGTDKSLAEDMRELRLNVHVPMLFEKKEEIRKSTRLGRSTDKLDALALTTYMPVELPGVVARRRQLQQPKKRNFEITAWS